MKFLLILLIEYWCCSHQKVFLHLFYKRLICNIFRHCGMVRLLAMHGGKIDIDRSTIRSDTNLILYFLVLFDFQKKERERYQTYFLLCSFLLVAKRMKLPFDESILHHNKTLSLSFLSSSLLSFSHCFIPTLSLFLILLNTLACLPSTNG